MFCLVQQIGLHDENGTRFPGSVPERDRRERRFRAGFSSIPEIFGAELVELVQFRTERGSDCVRRTPKRLPKAFAIRSFLEQLETATDDFYFALGLELLLELDHEPQLIRRQRDAGFGICFHTKKILTRDRRVKDQGDGRRNISLPYVLRGVTPSGTDVGPN